ncbi:hypothetical protein [Thauera sp. 2A1]|uniref:hypothetical protein n=1 Tax=Thauera sp. 2A1 TaxID=2570191 RepID=UPI001291FDAB|nr:hypothetical protein [Thauera sp. 2A1]KAI5913847.1 hypothetical protein GH664_15490 [Thauera sp. 2A1]
MNTIAKAISLAALFFALNAYSAAPCDCTAAGWIGECIATLQIRGTWVKVSTNVQQCSRVDWFVDDEKISQMTIVLNGSEVEDVSPRKPKAVVAQSCKVCKDNRIPVASRDTAPSDQPAQQSRKSPSTSLFSGTWKVSGTNSLGYAQKGEMTFTPIDDHRMKVSSLWEIAGNSWSSTGEGTVDGKTLRFSIGQANCSVTPTTENELAQQCTELGTTGTHRLIRQ